MIKTILLLTLLLVPLGMMGQPDKEIQIKKLIDLTLSDNKLKSLLDNIISTQVSYSSKDDAAFWESYKQKFYNSFKDSLKPKLVSTFEKYFTYDEIKALCDFYSSDIGQRALRKMDIATQELFKIGNTYGSSIVKQVLDERQKQYKKDQAFKMDNTFQGCHKFKVGKFRQIVNDTIVYYYERTENTQIETFGKGKSTYSVKWLNDCRYEITLIETNNPYYSDFIGTKYMINIYEFNDNSYKFVCHVQNNSTIYEGEMIKINE